MIRRLAEVKETDEAYEVHQELIFHLLYLSILSFANCVMPYIHDPERLALWFTACVQTRNFSKIEAVLCVRLRCAESLEAKRRKDEQADLAEAAEGVDHLAYFEKKNLKETDEITLWEF